MEHRLAPRLDVQVEARLLGRPKHAKPCRARNVSPGGLFVEITAPGVRLEPGDPICIELLERAGGQAAGQCFGFVIHRRDDGVGVMTDASAAALVPSPAAQPRTGTGS